MVDTNNGFRKKASALFHYFTPTERILWTTSILILIVSNLYFGEENPFAFSASLLGVTSLIFCAKGNPLGQLLMVIFGGMYGWISYSYAYYGEMLTYLGMSMPMAFVALISWLRHPYRGDHAEVEVNRLPKREIPFLLLLTVIVTTLSFFLLRHFGTSNLFISTFSVATSFAAVYLVFRRSPFFALIYAANDVVLIFLWTLATMENREYFSVVICFSTFLVNDLYGFFNWLRMRNHQAADN